MTSHPGELLVATSFKFYHVLSGDFRVRLPTVATIKQLFFNASFEKIFYPFLVSLNSKLVHTTHLTQLKTKSDTPEKINLD